MTTDRKKAILFLSLTLILGILIGSLIPAFYGRFRHRQAREMWTREGKEMRARDGNENKEAMTRQDRFSQMIMRVVKPDSNQAKQIKPLMDATALRIDALEKGSNERMASIMDSLKSQLQPILTPEQLKNLNDFEARAKSRWHGGRRPPEEGKK